MYTDVPTFTRCCFCLPLRQGLLAWSYVKLIYSILACVYIGRIFSLISVPDGYDIEPLIILSVLMTACILDIVFEIIFIVSAHMKKTKLMKIYYKYCLVMLGLTVIFIIGFLILMIIRIKYTTRRSLNEFIIADIVVMFAGPTICVFFHTILFIYMVLLVRSELLKLESNLPFKFVKSPVCEDADDVEKKVQMERAFYNRLSSDPGSVYSQCTIPVEN